VRLLGTTDPEEIAPDPIECGRNAPFYVFGSVAFLLKQRL
jgi:hypothetical protein